MSQLITDFRREQLDDIITLINQIKEIQEYEKRNRHMMNMPSFIDVIKGLDKELKGKIKKHKKEYGRDIPVYLIRKYVRSL